MSSSSGSSQPIEQRPLRPNSHGPLAKDVEQFLDEEYDQNFFKALADTVVERFKAHAPTDSFGESIKYQISARGKARDSLRKNIEREKNIETREKLLLASCLRDLAGVRILTYFPDDVPVVAKHIASGFQVIGKPSVKYSKRSILDPNRPNEESVEDRESADLVFGNYPKGILRQTNAEDIERDWKHTGFRAVLFYVDGSEAKNTEHDLSTESEPDLWKKRVEIQITTIVMHAWSEVEHDLIYKNPYQLPPDPTIDRMVDAVNGLAITNEILLQQLQENFQRSRRTEEEVFQDRESLKTWIFQHYLGLEPKDTFWTRGRRNFLHVIVELLYCADFFDVRQLTRKKVKHMLQERAEGSLDQGQSTQTPKQVHWGQLDNFHLLRNFLRNKQHSIDTDLSSQSADIQRLHKFMFASSVYSIWYGISSWSWLLREGKGKYQRIATLRCERNSPEKVFPIIDKINKILVGEWQYSSVPSNELKALDLFCEEFPSCTCCEEHEIATKLAKMSLFLCIRPAFFEYDDDDSKRIDEAFSGGTVEGHSIPSATPIDFDFLRRDFNKNRLDERHRADIPRFSYGFIPFSGHEGMRIPLMRRNVSWWREDATRDPLEFQMRSVMGTITSSVAELFWTEPANVITYLGFLLEEKRAVVKRHQGTDLFYLDDLPMPPQAPL